MVERRLACCPYIKAKGALPAAEYKFLFRKKLDFFFSGGPHYPNAKLDCVSFFFPLKSAKIFAVGS